MLLRISTTYQYHDIHSRFLAESQKLYGEPVYHRAENVIARVKGEPLMVYLAGAPNWDQESGLNLLTSTNLSYRSGYAGLGRRNQCMLNKRISSPQMEYLPSNK